MNPARPRVGLVLGAGGVLGGAWLAGALAALTESTGWDPATADVVVGTSAGSMIGAQPRAAGHRGRRPSGPVETWPPKALSPRTSVARTDPSSS